MCGITVTDIKVLAYKVGEQNEISDRFNTETQMARFDWYNSFMKRNLKTSVPKIELISGIGANSFNKPAIKRFFSNLKKLATTYKI